MPYIFLGAVNNNLSLVNEIGLNGFSFDLVIQL